MLLITDYSKYVKYDKGCKKFQGFSYIDLIKREQLFLKYLICNKYKKTKCNKGLMVVVYIHADFGKRQECHYKLLTKGTKDYIKFHSTDDYSDECSFDEAKKFFCHLN